MVLNFLFIYFLFCHGSCTSLNPPDVEASNIVTRHSILWNVDWKIAACVWRAVTVLSEIQGSPLPSSHCCPAEWPQIEHQETSASYHPALTGVLVRRICDVNSELHLLTSLTGLVVTHTTDSHCHSLLQQPLMLGTIEFMNLKLWASRVPPSNTGII